MRLKLILCNAEIVVPSIGEKNETSTSFIILPYKDLLFFPFFFSKAHTVVDSGITVTSCSSCMNFGLILSCEYLLILKQQI